MESNMIKVMKEMGDEEEIDILLETTAGVKDKNHKNIKDDNIQNSTIIETDTFINDKYRDVIIKDLKSTVLKDILHNSLDTFLAGIVKLVL